MTVGEGTSFGVLSTQPYRMLLPCQRGICHQLTHGPVILVFTDHGSTLGKQTHGLVEKFLICRKGGNPLCQLQEELFRNTGICRLLEINRLRHTDSFVFAGEEWLKI